MTCTLCYAPLLSTGQQVSHLDVSLSFRRSNLTSQECVNHRAQQVVAIDENTVANPIIVISKQCTVAAGVDHRGRDHPNFEFVCSICHRSINDSSLGVRDYSFERHQ